jgi:hypothetical protein
MCDQANIDSEAPGGEAGKEGRPKGREEITRRGRHSKTAHAKNSGRKKEDRRTRGSIADHA